MERTYLTEEEGNSFLRMIESGDLKLINFALDLVLDTDMYLPFKYNEVGSDRRLARALKSIPSDIQAWILVTSNAQTSSMPRTEELQKKINKVRSKHTM